MSKLSNMLGLVGPLRLTNRPLGPNPFAISKGWRVNLRAQNLNLRPTCLIAAFGLTVLLSRIIMKYLTRLLAS